MCCFSGIALTLPRNTCSLFASRYERNLWHTFFFIISRHDVAWFGLPLPFKITRRVASCPWRGSSLEWRNSLNRSNPARPVVVLVQRPSSVWITSRTENYWSDVSGCRRYAEHQDLMRYMIVKWEHFRTVIGERWWGNGTRCRPG